MLQSAVAGPSAIRVQNTQTFSDRTPFNGIQDRHVRDVLRAWNLASGALRMTAVAADDRIRNIKGEKK